MNRRQFLQLACSAALSERLSRWSWAEDNRPAPLRITGLRVTPVALPDPPLLAYGGCHGPYFLRNIVEVQTDGGFTGIGETRGGEEVIQTLEQARKLIIGQNAFSYRRLAEQIRSTRAYAGLELACLDACGKATGRRVCELLGGPVRDDVEFAAYLFYRYAADHPKLLADRRIVDRRGRGKQALDDWGEVRTPQAMADEAQRFRKQWGFRVFKLKAGVLSPKDELDSMLAMRDRLGKETPLRIDPNGGWRVPTAIEAAKVLQQVNLEYYEDPVRGQEAMAEVRRASKLRMSTNMCVTAFDHIPEAVKLQSVDIVLCDHHGWGGIPACQELGRICRTFGWGLSQHSNNHAGITMAAMIHVGALIPNLTYPSDTHYPWLPEGNDLITGGKLAIREGRMRVPDGPGLGVTVDVDKLAQAHEVYRKSGMRERDDAATMQMVEPGWQRRLY